MAYEQKDTSGSLFTNDRKEKETHPDRKGTALIDGVEYWVSGWDKEGQKGPWTSLAFQKKESKAKAAPGKIYEPKKPDPISSGRPLPIDDEIPFAPEFR